MLCVFGIFFSDIDIVDIFDNFESFYMQLICKLNELGIIYYDFNIGNMLYDKESESLFLIDFCDIYIEYYFVIKNDKEIIDW